MNVIIFEEFHDLSLLSLLFSCFGDIIVIFSDVIWFVYPVKLLSIHIFIRFIKSPTIL